MNKAYLVAILLFLGIGSNAFGQRPPLDPEKLQAARIAFITTRIDLKPEQAEKFWPIFNQYHENREKNHAAALRSWKGHGISQRRRGKIKNPETISISGTITGK